MNSENTFKSDDLVLVKGGYSFKEFLELSPLGIGIVREVGFLALEEDEVSVSPFYINKSGDAFSSDIVFTYKVHKLIKIGDQR